MPRIIEYTENEGSAQTSASTLMNLINSSKSSTQGMAGFQIKSTVVSSVSAVLFGQTTSMLAAPILGTGLSFLLGAGFGFVGGLVHRWRTDVGEAKEAIECYPELMEHHLRTTEPQLMKKITFDEWKVGVCQGNIVNQGHAIAALYSASPAIQRIREMKEESIISLAVEKLDK
jgi:hypothetical protein